MKKLFFAILLFTSISAYSQAIYLDCNVKEKYTGASGTNYFEDGLVNIKINDGHIKVDSSFNLVLFSSVLIENDSFFTTKNFTDKNGSKHSTELRISRVSGKLIANGTVNYLDGRTTYASYTGLCNKASGTKF